MHVIITLYDVQHGPQAIGGRLAQPDFSNGEANLILSLIPDREDNDNSFFLGAQRTSQGGTEWKYLVKRLRLICTMYIVQLRAK